MKRRSIDIYVVPTADFHESEYVGEHFKARKFITGFTGSAGTAVITLKEAGLWTDGRYFVQAEKQIEGSTVTLYRMAEEGVPAVEEFVKDLELYACNDTTQENFNKLLLEKDESLVYACLSLRPKSMEELLKKTGFAMPQMADILQRLIQKDFITESFKNYYIRKI